VFSGSFKYSLTQSVRALNAGWFLGLHIFGPIFFLLTSWTIFNVLGTGLTTRFETLTGLSTYMPFAVLGFAFQSLIMTAVWSGANGIRYEAEIGTLESIFVTPGSKVAWVLGKIAGSLMIALISTGVVLALGVAAFSYESPARPDILTAVLGTLLTLAGMVAFAFAVAGLTFLVKKGDDINQVLWPAMVFFSGLAFPVEALPQWGQVFAWIFPITHGLAITRGALLRGYGILDSHLAQPIGSILVLTCIYVPLGYIAFRYFLDKARRKGALATY